MKRFCMVVWLAGCAAGDPVDAPVAPPAAPIEAPAPSTSADEELPPGPTAVWTNTEQVEGLALSGAHVWVATRGGVERYRLDGSQRSHFTTQDGLDEVHVRDVRVEDDGSVVAVTSRSRCRWSGRRFACAPAKTSVPTRRSRGFFRGTRVTVELQVPGGLLVGTSGAGLWLTGQGAPVRWTPERQICGPHVTSMARHAGRLFVGTFHRGLCVEQGEGFAPVEAPFAMINEMKSTPMGLVVAASEGLFVRSTDETFEEVRLADDVRAVNSVAWHEGALWATTPESLWRIAPGSSAVRYRNPAGSVSLQAVASNGSVMWLASEDRGAIAFGEPFGGRGRFTPYDATRGLPASWALDVAVQPDGTAMLATLRHGLWQVVPDQDAHRQLEASDRWALRLESIHGWLAVGTQAGATLVAGAQRHRLRRLPDPRVHAFAPDGDGLLVGTERGLARYDLP